MIPINQVDLLSFSKTLISS